MSMPCNLFILCSLLRAGFTLVYMIMCLASMYLCLCTSLSLSVCLSVCLSPGGTTVDELNGCANLYIMCLFYTVFTYILVLYPR